MSLSIILAICIWGGNSQLSFLPRRMVAFKLTFPIPHPIPYMVKTFRLTLEITMANRSILRIEKIVQRIVLTFLQFLNTVL